LDNERRYSAAHHPSIFASVRPATKTAFLLIKDSPHFFFLSASFTATMIIRSAHRGPAKSENFSHKQKRKDQENSKDPSTAAFSWLALGDVVEH
jgi:hypothetical protein